jgi:formate hydrogenlyase transcriptional activator
MIENTKILVVDDDPATLQSTSHALKAAGYKVLEASTGRECIKKAWKEYPDLVLLDVILPDIDGIEVCSQIKAAPTMQGTFVVLLSGIRISSEHQTAGLDMGADGYIARPVSNDELLARVHSLVRIQQAEKKIKRVAEEWETTFNSIPDPISIHDKDFTIVRVNGAFADFVGKKAEHIIGRKCFEVIHRKEQPRETCPHLHTIRSGKPVTEEFFEPALEKYLQVSTSPIFNERNEIIGSVHIAQDITDRKRMEELLQKSHGEIEQRVIEQSAELKKANELLTASNEQLRLEIERRRQTGESLEERLQFEKLLSDLSVRFINISSEHVNVEIENALKEILEFFQFDRCGLLGFSPDHKKLWVTHAAYDSGVEHVSGEINLFNLFPWSYKRLVDGQYISVSNLEELPEEADVDRKSHAAMGIKSFLDVPLFTGGKISHVFVINSMRQHRIWREEYIPRIRLLGEIFVNALARTQMEEQLKVRIQEIENLRQQLEKENIYLRKEAQIYFDESKIIGESEAIKNVLNQAQQVAEAESGVLILGETGTGKELIAKAIHSRSKRKNHVMVKVNCASLPAALIESELFGREKGAYTGALTKQIGRFELANDSTIFLDEIAELPLELQAKLLRVLQDGEFERLGSPKTIRVNVRIIAATNRNMEEAIKNGNFREDLYYRLKVFPIEVPPLRQRQEDIPLLVHSFLNEFTGKMGKKIRTIPESTMEKLKQYHWPGNVRELRNIIEQAVIITIGDTLLVTLPQKYTSTDTDSLTFEEAERQHIVETLKKTGWRIKGRGGAAEILVLKPSTLYTKMAKLGIPTNRRKGGI